MPRNSRAVLTPLLERHSLIFLKLRGIRMCDNLLNGDAAEACLFKAASESKKIKIVRLEGVLKKCKSSSVGRKYFDQSLPYLVEEFGDSRKIGSKKILIIDESDIPESIATDLVLGLDLVINYMGHIIGIDVTTNPEYIEKKLRKKRALSDVYSRDFDIDHALILVVSERFSFKELEKVIKGVIEKEDYCQIVSL
jgi:hypothetical protein